ncbi:DUF4912 domain-containing protein [Coleofasciculus sp. FACHB-1120]|uniref:DUF4912 domain-containing protein n=1 Tax=Coleofasciculus sp. FACHB-1120 TaxID=2692783 RepID=UPI0016880576|nr:DUF4912 domain-containing protein [Coleofasciculus sp. FACHB-1120]MBD2743337.1 DUF4912 domain-containing protein [Coleofasciculus sp. FACHB-1120]
MAKERPPLEEMTLRQLRKVASECSISRYSRMRKEQLLTAIKEVQRTKISLGSTRIVEAQEEVEAAKFELGQEDRTGGTLASVDEGLGDLPGGYGESRVVLMPRDPQWAYTYWDIPNDHKEDLRRQGGQQLALRLYDVTDVNLEYQSPHSIQEYPCDELAREWYLPMPVSDRDYAVDIGYRCADGRWLVLARSAPVRVPPVYPSDWIEDQFITVSWEEDLRGKTFLELVPPAKKMAMAGYGSSVTTGGNPIYDEIFGMAQTVEAQRVAGSLFGSMQQVPGSMQSASLADQALSSYVFPSGVGMWAVPTTSGLTMSGAGMSGAGFSGSGIPMRPRQFWLVADAELIVYGATEPDATVTIGGRPIKLNSDGTFRFQMSFQDGLIDYPIMAVAVDGEQTRSIHMKFNRETPSRNTNTKQEAVEEWLS